MSDETLKVTITGVFMVLVAVVTGWFGRQPKPKRPPDEERDSDTQRMTALDPALMRFIERIVDERIAEISTQRDAAVTRADAQEQRADAAEQEVGRLRFEVDKLKARVAELEAKLGMERQSDIRVGDGA